MPWQVVSVPSSAKALLRKNREADFSSIQKIRAAIRLYSTLPLDYRIQLARDYTAQRNGNRGKEGLRTPKSG
jgi:hypothetical protein